MAVKVLCLSPTSMNLEQIESGLAALHEITVVRYDRLPPPIDRGVLDAADRLKPDVIVYSGQNDPRYLITTDAFQRLKKKAPTVLLAFDGTDATWTDLMQKYHDEDVFTVAVNIDGNENWPQREQDFTALTPVDPRYYKDFIPLSERPVKFGFAGGYASPSRAEIVNYLIEHAGLVVPRRNENLGSYQSYADFMRNTQIVLNVPWSGSDNSGQVKGRVIEAGLAGNILLEHIGASTSRWFTPDTDYALYSTKEMAASLASLIPKSMPEMVEMSSFLHRQVTRKHTPEIFWRKVFERI